MITIQKWATVRGIQPFYLGNRKVPAYWTADEVRRIIAVTHDMRYRTLFTILWKTGMRVSEALSLTPAHFDYYLKTVSVPTLKRKKHPVRVIPVDDDVLRMVAQVVEYYQVRPNERLFPMTRQAVWEAVERSCKMAELYDERSHPHTFRHSFAVHCVLNNVPLVVLNAWLGHADIRNTMIYAQVVARDTREFYDAIKW